MCIYFSLIYAIWMIKELVLSGSVYTTNITQIIDKYVHANINKLTVLKKSHLWKK